MKDNKKLLKYLADTISDRLLIQTTLGYTLDNQREYIQKTNSMILQKKKVTKELEEYYAERLKSRVGKFEDIDEFLERMESTSIVDDSGHIVFDYYKLGIDVIDNEFLNGKGVFQNCLLSIGADSGTGKTTLALQIIANLAYQGVKSQFFSFEMGDKQFFNEISPQAKNKLIKIAKTEYSKNLFLDFHSRDINDLATAIQMRADDGVKAFVIDSYLSIYAGDDEFTKMKQVVDMLATLKKELGILVIIIAQISKSDSFNGVFDFHGGNTLKYESDVALFIKLLQGEEDSTKRHIHCEKNRIFEDKQKIGIVTDYNRDTHKIEKISNFKDYDGVDVNGKKLRKLTFKK